MPGREAERVGVLFVCMGNICRSPVAEAIFADLVAAEGLDPRFRVDSAGTIDLHAGEAPDPRSAREAARRGLDRLGDHPLVLFMGECRRLASRAHRAEAGHAGLGLKVDLLAEAGGVDPAIAKRGDDGDGKTGELFSAGGHRARAFDGGRNEAGFKS